MIIKQKGYKDEELKLYKPDDADYEVMALPNTCWFCEYLTDIWWDYTNGPYMLDCVKENETNLDLIREGCNGECKYFKESI